jgi:DNA replication protein DnaC
MHGLHQPAASRAIARRRSIQRWITWIKLAPRPHLPPTRLKRRKYMSISLLRVDEMGYDPMNREEASLFFRLVSYRYAAVR